MTEKPSKPFQQGMTLMPGESAHVDIPLPPELAKQLAEHVQSGGGINFVDISAQTYGKYQFCTKAKDGMWYADDDFTGGAGCGKPKRGALPSPSQDTPELTARAREMHTDTARDLTETAMRSRKPWWRFWG